MGQQDQRERFMSHVRQAESGCWEWLGWKDHRGYGKATAVGRRGKDWAHRVAHELFVGTIPDGLHIDHLCRNVSCVNPDHLEAVNQAENLRRQADANRPTHCPQGHELIDPYIDGNSRKCRTCVKERVRLRRQRLAGADCLVGTD